MMNTENTALQMIAEAARCPDYAPKLSPSFLRMPRQMDTMPGYEQEREKVIANTRALLEGLVMRI